jgi:hypothetical protein
MSGNNAPLPLAGEGLLPDTLKTVHPMDINLYFNRLLIDINEFVQPFSLALHVAYPKYQDFQALLGQLVDPFRRAGAMCFPLGYNQSIVFQLPEMPIDHTWWNLSLNDLIFMWIMDARLTE